MRKISSEFWKSLLIAVIVYGILWTVFRWLEFTSAQSFVLCFLFGACYLRFRELGAKSEQTADFTPYRVTISIHNPRDLLFKYKFVRTEEEWKQMCERVKETSALRRGLNFTVLSLSKDGSPHLIWWDDYKAFQAGIPSFEDDLEGLECPGKNVLGRKWSPRLYFGYRHGKGNGYSIALCVRDHWWEENKTENTETEQDHRTGSLYLKCGTLPYGEIGLDYEVRRQDRKAELQKLGWAIKDSQEPDFPAWDTIEVQNEYFSVSQIFLETD